MDRERLSTVERESAETNIVANFGICPDASIEIETDIPFLSHMLHSFAFHGGFHLHISAHGDVDVDPHHLVEDCGLVIGTCIRKIITDNKQIRRFAAAKVPMDDALCEAVIDLSNRPYCVYNVQFTQDNFAGNFSLHLIREFFTAMSNNASMNLHLCSHYGQNGHHIVEALFKASALALATALEPAERLPSTKGMI